MDDLILIRYGELSTKGKNKKLFINKLQSNIIKKLKKYPKIEVVGKRDRMYLTFNEYDVNEIINELKDVFGIQSFSLAKRVISDYQVIEDLIFKVIDFKKHSFFKVITKRIDKRFPLRSDDINRKIATKILQETDLKVKMKDYDLAINIEIHSEYSYIFFDKVAGAQGYPVGISGNGLLMLSGGIDSPVAGYLSMKRGIQLEIIHFESPPYTSKKALNKVLQLASSFLKYTDEIIVHNVPFTKLQLEINKHCDANYSMTLLRRMMYRISERIATIRDCDIIINGESIAQVASQTLKSMSVINQVVNIPVIRPLACFDKLEIIEIAKKIDTYETSILPYEDCCTIFLPKSPIIKPIISKVIENENRFDYESLLSESINETQKIIINSKTVNDILNIDDDIF